MQKIELAKKEINNIMIGETEISLPAKIPLELIIEMTEVGGDENIMVQTKRTLTVLKEIFYLENEKEKVDKLIRSMDTENIRIIIEFLGHYIRASYDEKKKENSAS